MSHTIVNPADEQVVATVTSATIEETDAAIVAAAAAQRDWAGLAPVDRARMLRRFAEAVDGAVEELAAIEVRNSGHPISQARWEAGHVRDVGRVAREEGEQDPAVHGAQAMALAVRALDPRAVGADGHLDRCW